MRHEQKPADAPKVRCGMCMMEIPLSESKVPEGRDYALSFCGIHCYQKWAAKQSKVASVPGNDENY